MSESKKREKTKKAHVLVEPQEGHDEAKSLRYVYWYWDRGYDEGDSYIDAPCELRLYEDNSLWGQMKKCKNRTNPFTLSFDFQVRGADRLDGEGKQGAKIAATWRVFTTCTLNFGESKSNPTVNDTLDYDEYKDRVARLDITV